MRILKRIESKDSLAELFNEYIKLLQMLETIAWPGYMSMNEYIEKLKDEEDWKNLYSSSLNITQLIICNESLHSIHDCIHRAIKDIERFQTEYNSDWKYFAIQNRINILNEWGGGKDDDWDGNEVKYKDSIQELIEYSIKRELQNCFDENETRGDYIGTSSKEDFANLSIIARNQSDFCITKFFQSQGEVLNMYRRNEMTGEMEVIPDADRIENEINDDIKNTDTVFVFEFILDKCMEANQFYKSINDSPEDSYKFEELKNRLLAIKNISF